MVHLNDLTYCEFCDELAGVLSSRFANLYRNDLQTRVVLENDAFVALPTIGQLFAGSLLILPRRHAERLADLNADEVEQLSAFLQAAFASVQSRYVLFEHGARCVSGGGCGIYHAHLHIVPVPTHFKMEDMLPSERLRHPSLLDAWNINRVSEEYIVARDTLGTVASIDQNAIREHGFGSQHMRKLLVRHFSLNRPWDWREYKAPEQDLLQTVAARRPSNVL
ncbi:HIT family protein [Allorhodopirellula heiligendammensis]|uniref:HIT domain protein n=1 Tax=Allorhodopirellula heiligendammensis TaxID=2714739 RepID=A0A5C6C4H3_9BACT|nr:HIT domain-containing protein [Allorhodopirellula heiligendammensis]TWU19510.1 HIT domain protein [Allorhodopirellula heiligendammensis]